jgi:8-oxo-dGTP diphosphatase
MTYDANRYPPFAVTADLVVFTLRAGALCALLIRRGAAPYAGKLALPGGFTHVNEDLETAAYRELQEEVNVGRGEVVLEQLKTYGAPARDPRMRVVSVAWLALGANLPEPRAGSDAAEAFWMPVAEALRRPMQLAFDHAQILGDGLERARSKIEYSTLATAFCSREFTVGELREVYEALWSVELDPRNFHRKVTGADGFLTETGERTTPAVGRPAMLYRAGPAEQLNPPILRAGPVGDTAEPPVAANCALSITRCPDVDAAREQKGHPCRKIVSLQSATASDWQVPEAWAGNLEAGRIAFISSNPSLSEAGDSQSGAVAEEYPRGDWADEDIADFVMHRFDPARMFATPDGHFHLHDGSLSPKAVTFWAGVRNRAGEIYGRPANPVDDYVMTEVVHCKSKDQKWVKEAASNCADRHLDHILALSPAPLIVILGKMARELLVPRWDLGPEFGTAATAGKNEWANLQVRNVGGRDRVIAFLWHPSGMTAPKTFAKAYPTQLSQLQELVAGRIAPKAFKRDGTEDAAIFNDATMAGVREASRKSTS